VATLLELNRARIARVRAELLARRTRQITRIAPWTQDERFLDICYTARVEQGWRWSEIAALTRGRTNGVTAGAMRLRVERYAAAHNYPMPGRYRRKLSRDV